MKGANARRWQEGRYSDNDEAEESDEQDNRLNEEK